MQTDPKSVLFVLGAPRTGTSAISGVFSSLGVHFGDETHFVDPKLQPHNPKFYELIWVNSLNDEIFEAIGTTWRGFDFYDRTPFENPALSKYKLRIRESVQKEWGSENRLIGIKDPRISLLFPLWQSVLSDMGYELRCAITLRHPEGYLRSESKLATEWPVDRFRLDWLRHVLSALYFTRGLNRRIVDFDSLLSNTHETVTELSEWIGAKKREIGKAIAAISQEAYHHDPVSFASSNSYVDLIYEALRSVKGDADLFDVSIYEPLLKFWPLIRSRHDFEIAGLLDERNGIIRAREETIRARDESIAGFQDELSTLREQSRQASDLNESLQAATVRLQDELSASQEKSKQSEALNASLQVAIAELQTELSASREESRQGATLNASLQAKVEESETVIRVRDHELRARADELRARDEFLRARNEAITSLQNELAELSESNDLLMSQLSVKAREIDHITRSLGWRVLKRYGLLKYRYLLPVYRMLGQWPYSRTTRRDRSGAKHIGIASEKRL